MPGVLHCRTDDAECHAIEYTPVARGWIRISIAQRKRDLRHRLGLNFVRLLGIFVCHRVRQRRPTCQSIVCTGKDVEGRSSVIRIELEDMDTRTVFERSVDVLMKGIISEAVEVGGQMPDKPVYHSWDTFRDPIVPGR